MMAEMEAEEASALCWVLGLAGFLASCAAQALHWWQAKEVPAGRDHFFLRCAFHLLPWLLWAAYALLLSPAALASLVHPGDASSHAWPRGDLSSSSSRTRGYRAPGSPGSWEWGVDLVVPHTALLCGSVVSAVSLAGLALCLLPYAHSSAKLKAKAVLALGAVTCLVLTLLHSLSDPRGSSLGAAAGAAPGVLRVLRPCAAVACVVLPGYLTAVNLGLVASRGYTYPFTFLVGVAELARSILWASYGAACGDAYIAVPFLLLGVCDAFFLAVTGFVDHTRGLSASSLSQDDGSLASYEGYEMVAPRDPLEPPLFPETRAGWSAGAPGTSFEDLDREFNDWLQQDVILGKRAL